MNLLFIGKCVIVMNDKWKNINQNNRNFVVGKTLRKFHNKTVWINRDNLMMKLSSSEISWVKNNSGSNSSYLPSIYSKKVPFGQAKSISNRGSIREYKDEYINLDKLKQLLNTAFGSNKMNYSRRYPSAGGLFTVVPIMYVFKDSKELNNGIYVYDANKYDLLKIKSAICQDKDLLNALGATKKEDILPSRYAIGYAVNFDGSIAKYGLRGYRHALIEVGLMAQAFRETCIELEIGEYCYSAFDDTELTYASNLSIRDMPICLVQWFGVI